MIELKQHPATITADVSTYLRALTGFVAVFINGHWRNELSTIPTTHGIYIVPVHQAKHSTQQHIQTHFHDAATHDGLFIHLTQQIKLNQTIHVVFYQHDQTEDIQYYNNILLAEENTQVNIVIHYLSDSCHHHMTTTNHVHLHDHAELHWHHLQNLGRHSDHTHHIQVKQQQHSDFQYHQFDIGGHKVHHEIHCQLLAEYTRCSLNGLYQLNGQQHVNNISLIEHMKPNGYSREYFKGILDGRSHGLFRGKTYVAPHAIHTDAKQYNRNLLLSNNAQADSLPALEIYADDVQCEHGATVSQLDANELFYLHSRGIAADEAKRLLCDGFAREMVTRVNLTELTPLLNRLFINKSKNHD
jgi:Fe-S cluster assembly protein SufD